MGYQTTNDNTGRNIILTTPGGSGSTYFCKVLNEIPSVVALNEPIPLRVYREETTENVCRLIKECFRRARNRLKLDGKAKQLNEKGSRICSKEFGLQTEPFDLVIKQPLTFTALIGHDELKQFEWYAFVRNPLMTLCSWVGNVKLQAGREGRATTAELHAPELRELLMNLDGNGACKEELRLALLNWAFGKYGKLPCRNIVRYEDFVRSPVNALALIIPAAKENYQRITVRDGNANPKHHEHAKRFASRIFKEPPGAAILNYYNKDDVNRALSTLNRIAFTPNQEEAEHGFPTDAEDGAVES